MIDGIIGDQKMNKKKERLKKVQKKKLGRLFLRVVIITFIVCGVLIGGGITLYNKFLHNNGGSGIGSLKEDPLGDINKTIAVFGVDDEGYRTDVILVINFDSHTDKVKVISVPRDTRVVWSETQKQNLLEDKGYSMSVSKINEMTTYGGIENIRKYTIDELENLLDMRIDNYVIVTLDAFRKLVDAVGGVEVEVPALENGEGLHYDDNYQNLHIHLEPGLQTLDGEAAEGLVRFRYGYAEGDVGRIKTQQLFLEAFARKLLSPSIITKVPQIVGVIFDSVTTDVKLSDIPAYSRYLKNIDPSNISFNIIPGESERLDGKWYYIADEAAMPEFIYEVFNDEETAVEGEAETVIDYNISIEVLNSTAISGAASRAKAELEEAGYVVSNTGNYTPDILTNTLIYAKDISKANQFKSYYPNCTVVQTNNINYDVQIILGNDIAQ